MTNGLCGWKGCSLYEGGILVPGMIEWPDVITSNKLSSFPVVSSDLMSTVLDILDIKPADNHPTDGVSILLFYKEKWNTETNPYTGCTHFDRVLVREPIYSISTSTINIS